MRARRSPRSTTRFLIVGIDGGGGGFFGFKLKEWSEREKKGAATKQEIQNLLNENAGVQAFVFAPPSLPGARRRPADPVRAAHDRRSVPGL